MGILADPAFVIFAADNLYTLLYTILLLLEQDEENKNRIKINFTIFSNKFPIVIIWQSYSCTPEITK